MSSVPVGLVLVRASYPGHMQIVFCRHPSGWAPGHLLTGKGELLCSKGRWSCWGSG